MALELIGKSQIVVENFRPGQLEAWGLGVDAIEAVNPSSVPVRISGYGQNGLGRNQAAFGVIGEAKGGLRHLTNHPDSALPPPRTGVSLGIASRACMAPWQR